MKKQIKWFVYLLLSFVFLITEVLCFSGPASANTLVPLSSLTAGDTVNFAGHPWIILNPTTGYLLMQGKWGGTANSKRFDSTGNQTFDPANPNNIAYYLNNPGVSSGVYSSLSAADQALIQTHSWTIGNQTNESSVSVDAKIGLISYSAYILY